jgi:hypothetical protein
MKTFYIASSCGNIAQTRALAGQLRQLGLDWVHGHDWTLFPEPESIVERHKLVVADIRSAVDADVFVLLRTDVTSHGAHAELGARLGSGQAAHVILQGTPPHLFYDHPFVAVHQTTEEFLDWFGKSFSACR